MHRSGKLGIPRVKKLKGCLRMVHFITCHEVRVLLVMFLENSLFKQHIGFDDGQSMATHMPAMSCTMSWVTSWSIQDGSFCSKLFASSSFSKEFVNNSWVCIEDWSSCCLFLVSQVSTDFHYSLLASLVPRKKFENHTQHLVTTDFWETLS